MRVTRTTQLRVDALILGARVLLALFVIAVSLAALTEAARADERNLADLTLAELMNEPVTSVSKKATRLSDSATAITVITADDLRRLGITSIPEALRLVPGFDVSRIDASHWAISARGFNFQYSNTLLVLIDGRSVYTPTFGGVYWDSQDVALEDLERIEVIRGPGATLWGVNAVNGVVNVITKPARDTQGLVLSAALGSEDRPTADARYGGTLGSDVHYRAYAKYFEREGLRDGDAGLPDGWRSVRTGFRADWEVSADRLLTVQGDYYSVHSHSFQLVPTFTLPFTAIVKEDRPTEGFNLVGRWTRTLSERSHVTVQAYFDSYARFQQSRDTADVEIEHRFSAGERHDIVWGVGYRFTTDELHLGPALTSLPASRDTDLFTAFLQDDLALLPNRLRLTAGVKLEHNPFTGFETQPSVRTLWTPSTGHTLWASASRAVSTPSRFYNDSRFSVATFPAAGGVLLEAALIPNENLPSQTLDAYEIGYRVEPVSSVYADLAAFYNIYDNLYGISTQAPEFAPTPVPHVVLPLLWSPNLDGRSYGAELAVNYKPLDSWRLTGTYSWLHLRVRPDAASAGGSPAHQFGLRSYASLAPRFELNTALYYVSSIQSLKSPTETVHIDSYVRLDVGLVYQATRTLEVGAWGQNLLERRHAEVASQNTSSVSEVPRSALVRVTKRF
jgi:iron complex outermembrane recepter protein